MRYSILGETMVRPGRLIGTVAVVAAALAVGAGAASAQIANRGFETPIQGGGFGTVSAGGSMDAWQVSAGSVDLINSYWTAREGSQSLDLSGGSAGTIYQDFTLSQGGSYNLFFSMAGNPAGGNMVKRMEVSFGLAGGTLNSSVFTFDVSNSTFTNMGWVDHSWAVTASEAGTYRIQFTSLENNSYGPALDRVGISAAATVTPEPATFALLGTGLLALGGIGIRRRRARD